MQFSRNSILRQLSRKEGWRSASKRWTSGDSSTAFNEDTNGGDCGGGYSSMEGLYGVYSGGDTAARSKRVMVVVDETSRSKHAMMWALTHLTNKGDLMTLLHVVSPHDEASPSLAQSLGSLCKACKPEVDVEALVIQGPKLATVLSQVKKLEVSVLVLGQKKSAPLISCLCGPSRSEELVNRCINGADCLTIGVRKQCKGVGGYLINTRWQKNFWLLA
ncbi:UspA [Arabidopsis thaliana x Arabidopsis arenosa]|uniref:UspA n=1 Tax=Arabidopsis thaliana x Arabidopsis arenosa TaxID=1240361 RepID=A0A8T2C863_9BRAS|nr:UspA [Arabidopsis thaliana x Arabidopsis arenosa]